MEGVTINGSSHSSSTKSPSLPTARTS
jgi:hypothetical protein